MECELLGLQRMLLPRPKETALLQACLCQGDKCRDAWERWLKIEPQPFRLEGSPRRLQPLLWSNLQEQGIELPRALKAQLATAHLREERRFLKLKSVFEETLRKLPCSPLLIKGPPLARWYPQAGLRHCHDLDLIFRNESERHQAQGALSELGWAQDHGLVHPCGLPLTLHITTTRVPIYRVSGTRQSMTREQSYETLAPHQVLISVLLHGMSCTSSRHLVWICDAYFLAQSGSVRWESLIEETEEDQRLPLYLGLSYLENEFDIDIPSDLVNQLKPEILTQSQLNFACWSAATAKGGFLPASAGLPWRLRCQLAWQQLFPSTAFLAWAYPSTRRWLRSIRNIWESLRPPHNLNRVRGLRENSRKIGPIRS